jgi:hypothetical protein
VFGCEVTVANDVVEPGGMRLAAAACSAEVAAPWRPLETPFVTVTPSWTTTRLEEVTARTTDDCKAVVVTWSGWTAMGALADAVTEPASELPIGDAAVGCWFCSTGTGGATEEVGAGAIGAAATLVVLLDVSGAALVGEAIGVSTTVGVGVVVVISVDEVDTAVDVDVDATEVVAVVQADVILTVSVQSGNKHEPLRHSERLRDGTWRRIWPLRELPDTLCFMTWSMWWNAA